MVDQDAHRRRQAAPGREHEMDDAGLAAPVPVDPDQPSRRDVRGAGMVGQERDPETVRRRIAECGEVAAGRARRVAQGERRPVLSLEPPFDVARNVGAGELGNTSYRGRDTRSRLPG